MRVCGDCEELGEWDPQHSLALEWTDGDVWVGCVAIPRDQPVEFKFVVIPHEGHAAIWEGGPNRRFTSPARGTDGAVFTIKSTWGDTSASVMIPSSPDAVSTDSDEEPTIPADDDVGGGAVGMETEDEGTIKPLREEAEPARDNKVETVGKMEIEKNIEPAREVGKMELDASAEKEVNASGSEDRRSSGDDDVENDGQDSISGNALLSSVDDDQLDTPLSRMGNFLSQVGFLSIPLSRFDAHVYDVPRTPKGEIAASFFLSTLFPVSRFTDPTLAVSSVVPSVAGIWTERIDHLGR